MKKLRNTKKSILLLFISPIFIIILGFLIIYFNYKKIIIKQQQNQMITLAETAANNVEHYINEKIDVFNYIFDYTHADIAPENLRDQVTKTIKRLLPQEPYIESIHYYNLNNFDVTDLPFYISNNYLKEQISNSIDFNDVIIGPWALTEEHTYTLFLMKAVGSDGDATGLVVGSLNLTSLYNLLVRDIKIGSYGYCTLKDQNGKILMHKDSNQIGLDSYYDRLTQYPDLQPNEVKELLDLQKSGTSGSTIVRSYWWGNNESRLVDKIISYAPLKIGPYTWILNTIMSYDELSTPIQLTFNLLLTLSLVMIGIFSVLIYFFGKTQHQKEQYELELVYKEQLNVATNQLRKHEEALHQSNRIRSIGMFSNEIAHEINNLLTPIQIYCDLLSSQLENQPDALSDVNEIMQATSHCSDLTKTLLSYSRSSANHEKEHRFDCTQIITNTINMLRNILPKNMILYHELPSSPLFILGNPNSIKQIIMNLCTNAYQAMEETGGILTITVVKHNNTIQIVISDTGTGIPKEQLDVIFEPFYSTKDAAKGTGLGLPITAQLVSQLCGTIEVVSVINEGTTFTITLPLSSDKS